MACCYLQQTNVGEMQLEDTGESLIFTYRDYNDWIMEGEKLHTLIFNKSTLEFYDTGFIFSQKIY